MSSRIIQPFFRILFFVFVLSFLIFLGSVVLASHLINPPNTVDSTYSTGGGAPQGFCVSGDYSSYYTHGRYVTVPARSSGAYQVDGSSYEGGQCAQFFSGKTVISFIGTGPSSMTVGDTVCLFDTDPGVNYDCRNEGADTTPPVQSNIQATNITQTSATVTWTTDESATHTIKYDTTSGSYDSYANTKAAGTGTTSASGDL